MLEISMVTRCPTATARCSPRSWGSTTATSTFDASPGTAEMHVVVIGAGFSGMLAAIQLEPRRDRLHRAREGRDGRRDLVGEHLSGLRRRHADASVLAVVRSAPGLVALLRQAARAVRLPRAASPPSTASRNRSGSASRSRRPTGTTDEQLWRIRTTDADGTAGELTRANAIITGTGLLQPPACPRIHGLERFAGPAMHTARWDPSVSDRGQARRRDRHRGERDAARPQHRRRRRAGHRLPALGAVGDPPPQLHARGRPPPSSC